MDARRIWQAVLGELQLQMTRATYETWLRDTLGLAFEDGTLIVATENAYAKEWLENRLLGTIKRTATGILGRSVEVRFTVRPHTDPPSTGVSLLEAVTPRAAPASGLNPRYTFETFIVGNSNRLVHAAAYAAAERPAEAYNPLFIYGGVGLGKTHLLHAVGQFPHSRGLRVLYVSSEAFTNDLINAIRSQTTEEFRAKYRQIDVLLVDDIQFIAGKESTQEAFFHTFNALHAANKQIVVSSDRPPKAIPTLEERLRSRFEWGLIADIQPPDLETRIAILRFKAESASGGLPVPAPVLDHLAHKMHRNIRELEGALNRVVAYARLTGLPLDVEVAEAALRDFTPRREPPSLEEVLATVARFYRLELDELRSPRRAQSVARPRQVAMYLARQETRASLQGIGSALGGRDHTTILHGCEKIAAQLKADETLRRELLSIKELLYRTTVNTAIAGG